MPILHGYNLIVRDEGERERALKDLEKHPDFIGVLGRVVTAEEFYNERLSAEQSANPGSTVVNDFVEKHPEFSITECFSRSVPYTWTDSDGQEYVYFRNEGLGLALFQFIHRTPHAFG